MKSQHYFLLSLFTFISALQGISQHVGINTNDPQAPLHVASSGQVLTPGGLVLLGDTSEAHLQMDFDRIQSLFNNTTLELRLQPEGGDFRVGTDAITVKQGSPDFVGINYSNPTTELHVLGEMQLATSGFTTSQKDKIAIRGTLESQSMLGLGWLKNSGGIGTVQGSTGSGNRSMIDTYEMYYKSEGTHRWFINQIATSNATPMMILNELGRLGLGVDNPESSIHVEGTNEQMLRLHTTGGSSDAGIDLIRLSEFSGTDWRIINDGGTLKFLDETDNFLSSGQENMRISSNGFVGIGTSTTHTKLTVDGGESINDTDGEGDMQIGSPTGTHIRFDNNEIQARNGDSPSTLYLQYWNGDLLLAGQEDGQVGIGITSSGNLPAGYLLAVDGKIISEEVRVELSGDWPDYVFKEGYDLTPLTALENQIAELGHLPGIPSAKTIEDEGFELGDMQKRLLEKIEELTLYVIQLQNENIDIKKEIEVLKSDTSH